MSIRNTIIGALGALVAVLFLTVASVFWVLGRLGDTVSQTDDAIDAVTTRAVPLLAATKDLQLEIVEVQQWLTDVSATRAQDGLGDGFTLAEDHAKRFREHSKEAIELAEKAGLPEVSAQLRQMQDDFGPFHDTGVEMARAFVSGGPASGNRIMPRFDAAAERLNEDLEQLAELVQKQIDASMVESQHSAHASIEKVDLFRKLAALPVLLGLAVVCVTTLLALGITRRLSAITGVMGRLAAGDTSVSIPDRDRRDEIGSIAAAIEVFKDGLVESARLRAERDEAQARSAQERRAAIAALVERFHAEIGPAIGEIARFAGTLNSLAQSMADAAGDTSNRALTVSDAARQATENVHTVAAAAEELSVSVRSIQGQVDESRNLVAEAVRQSTDTDQRIRGLSEAVDRINEVSRLIGEIAAQTNLLALNATIESARAGEAGKGFAVVAAEVKALSGQTARATGEITQQLTNIQGATQQSSRAILAVSATIERLDGIAGTIASAVQQQGEATREISRSVQLAAGGNSEVSTNIRVVSESAVQTGSASRELLARAAELGTRSQQLQHRIDDFLREIAA